jgi:hypothetical protein
MMQIMRLTMMGLMVAVVLWGGLACQNPPERLNAPPQGSSERPHPMQDTFAYMVDNALLEDMSMSAVHFVPHQPDLNALGARRLARYASVLQAYGGKLRYDGMDDPPELAAGRIEQVKTFLLAEGLDADRIEVVQDLASGRGMCATEAILIREAAKFAPTKQGAGQSSGPDLSGSLGGGKS